MPIDTDNGDVSPWSQVMGTQGAQSSESHLIAQRKDRGGRLHLSKQSGHRRLSTFDAEVPVRLKHGIDLNVRLRHRLREPSFTIEFSGEGGLGRRAGDGSDARVPEVDQVLRGQSGGGNIVDGHTGNARRGQPDHRRWHVQGDEVL